MKNLLILTTIFSTVFSCNQNTTINNSANYQLIKNEVVKIDSIRVISQAEQYLALDPIPMTTYLCERSLGSINDFYSEGDYWWPDPENPDGAYIRRDGMSNPDNFTDHRKAMRDFSQQVSALSAAYLITRNSKYSDHAVRHFQAWFVDADTRMNPNMNYAQAIKGICPGRGVGLIDGIHLVEPARAASILHDSGCIPESDFAEIKAWYVAFLDWMTTHEYGIDERDRKNNHGTCWVMQAAEYARLTENQEVLAYCRDRYQTVLLPNQMSLDGSFHLELKRTKPYGYSLFNVDMMSMVCHILSSEKNNLWTFFLPDARGMQKGMEFIFPYMKNKSDWPFNQDVMYWDQWPVRHPSLLFAGLALNKSEYIDLWRTLEPLPKADEGLRNFPIREPLLWLD